jgi:hypothetical protein
MYNIYLIVYNICLIIYIILTPHLTKSRIIFKYLYREIIRTKNYDKHKNVVLLLLLLMMIMMTIIIIIIIIIFKCSKFYICMYVYIYITQ